MLFLLKLSSNDNFSTLSFYDKAYRLQEDCGITFKNKREHKKLEDTSKMSPSFYF